MAGILSGLSSLGLDDLENIDIYAKPENENQDVAGVQEVPKVDERELIYDKTFTCPVCDNKFSAKIMKTGKAKMLGTDADLRPRYEGIDAGKYDVEVCPKCGYAALSRFFPNVTAGQARLIREAISEKVHMHPYDGEIYTYEEAMERYTLALVNAVVKRARASEKAYICLKSAWVVRGYQEALEQENPEHVDVDALHQKEEEYLQNAYHGFLEAVQQESFPMCGMDEVTVDYLIAELAFHFKKYDVAGKLVASILTSPSANARTKDKARDLKDQILEALKRK